MREPAGRGAAPARGAGPGRTVILGIDPGTVATGYGIIEISRGRTALVACGLVRNGSKKPMPARLKFIHESLAGVIRKFRPDQVAVETAFYGKNAQSALKLGQARGVAILAAVSADLPLAEYSPREVKKAVAGNGNASKQQVQYMVRSYLALPDSPAPFDVTDALAVAICHGNRHPNGGGRYTDWKSYLRAHPEKAGGTGRRR